MASHWIVVYLTFLFLSGCLHCILGSKITFSGSPSDIKEGLYDSLTLLCSLEDTAASAGVTGRRDTGGHPGETTRRDLNTTPDNADEIFSIILMKDGHDIASVTHTHPASAVANSTRLSVAGSVSGTTGEPGYLELVRDFPNGTDRGEYTCEINASNASNASNVSNAVGHNVVFSSSLKIVSTQPTMGELIVHMRAQQMELRHRESGRIDCGRSSDWKGQGHHYIQKQLTTRANDVHVTFNTTYFRAPSVKLDVSLMDSDSNTYVRYITTVMAVTRTGFTVRCETWGDTLIYDMRVSWLSLP